MNTAFSSPAPDKYALLAGPRLLRQPDRGENREARPIYLRGGRWRVPFSELSIPGSPPAYPQASIHGVGTVSHRYLTGVAPMLMPSTWEQHPSNTVAILGKHPSDTGPGVVSSLEGIQRATHPDALGTPPCGALASAHGALAPEHESPRSQQPRMSTSFATKGLHELALRPSERHRVTLDAADSSLQHVLPAFVTFIEKNYYVGFEETL